MHTTTSVPAEACSPESWDGPDASARTPEWLACCIARLILLFLKALLSLHTRRTAAPAWLHDRPELPAGSAQAEAGSVRGSFGTSIARMCRRHGIGPGHHDWPELSRAIVAFGGSLAGFRAGAQPCRAEWWEDPNIVPGMVPFARTPAAAAATTLQAVANTAPPTAMPAATAPASLPASWLPASWLPASWLPASWLPAAWLSATRQLALARAGPWPPTGPPGRPVLPFPVSSDARGQPMASPAILIRAA